MGQVIFSAALVAQWGYIGMMVCPEFGIICAIAVATACIVYALQQRTQTENKET